MNTIKPEVINHNNKGLIPKKKVRQMLAVKTRKTFVKDYTTLDLNYTHFTWGEIKLLYALRLFLEQGKVLANKCLGYYGASDEVNRELDYDGYPPEVSQETKEGIYTAIEKSYPKVKDMDERNKKAVAQWVINEG